MKFFDCNWDTMLKFCLLWEDIPEESQSLYLYTLTPPLIPVASVNVFMAKPLVDNGFLRFSSSKKSYEFTREAEQFHKLLRSLDSSTLFDEDADSIGNLIDYLIFFYTSAERLDLTERCRDYRKDDEDLAAQVGNAYWLKMLLETKNLRTWETGIDSDNQLSFDMVPGFDEHFNLAQTIVRVLIEGDNPIPLANILAIANTEDAEIISKTMHFLLKNIFVYLSVDDFTGTPVIGIRPSIHNFINPADIELEKLDLPMTACPPFLVDDMMILLVEASVNPIPVKQSDNKPYAKSARDIFSRFYQLPDVCNYLHAYTDEERLRMAMYTLISLELASISKKDKKSYLVALKTGENWLKLPDTDRLEETLQSMQNYYAYTEHEDLSRNRFHRNTTWCEIIDATRQKHNIPHKTPNLSGSIYSAFKKFASFKQPVTEHSFMRNQIFVENPFFTLFHSGIPYPESQNWSVEYIHDDVDMANSWLSVLKGFIINKAIPYGFINLGEIDDDGHYAISLTDIGLYFIGELKTLPEVGHSGDFILIQPNFEIVFMAQNPRAEVKLGQFCERLGSGIGTLFIISRKGILEGASNGLDAEYVLDTMVELSHKPVPPNVAEQVKNWISQCRKVSISTKILFQCPDRETALQVKSSGGDKVEHISDTVVAVSDRKFAKALEKKLEKKGIFRERG